MISLQKDSNSRLLKSYLPPFRGTWKTLPPYLLSDDTVQDSFNVSLLNGRLRSRSGLNPFDTTNLGNKVLGSFLTTDTSNTKFPICSTKNQVFQFSGAWNDITGTVSLGASDSNQVRMSSIQVGTLVYILYCNGVDVIKVISQSDYTLRDIVPHSGTLPVLNDICTSFERFVGITPPYTVTWCDQVNNSYLNFTNWPPDNQVILSDTEDSIVAIRNLGTLGLAVYKEGNIFVGFANQGTNAAAFRFEHRGEYEGPANPNAIVNINGSHMYMTPTGRIGLFDGTQQAFIADGLWPYLQDNVDISNKSKIFGVYDYRTGQVTFWYPRVGDSGSVQGMLTINIPFPLAGISSYAYFLGLSNFECTNGLSIRYYNNITSPLIFGNNNNTFKLDKTYFKDNITDFSCNFTTPLFRPPSIDPVTSKILNTNKDQSDIYRPTLEIYTSRDSTRGIVQVSGVTSNTLETDGSSTQQETIDLTQLPVNEYIGFNETGSYLGAKFSWNSSAQFEYKGCDVYGRSST